MADRLAAVRVRTLAAEHGLPYIELNRRALNPAAVRTVPLELLARLGAVPFDLVDDVLSVALADPSPTAVAELQNVTGRRITVALTAREDVVSVLDELARGGT